LGLIYCLLGFSGRYPHKKVIQTAHTADLAVGFGRKVRNLVDSEVYKSVFPDVGLRRILKQQDDGTPVQGAIILRLG
jgi:hypothetical protein